MNSSLALAAQALYKQDLPAAEKALEGISAEERQKLFDFEQAATGDYPKIQALEKLFEEKIAVPPNEPAKRIIPEGVQELTFCAFNDAGFDFRFDFKGDYFKPVKRTPCYVRCYQAAIRILFIAKAYLSLSRREREIRKLVLQCERLEKKFSDYLYLSYIQRKEGAIYCLPQIEHDFFNRVGELYKKVFTAENLQGRLFPSEVLVPLHNMNKPQNHYREWYVIPNRNNSDLGRTGFSLYSKFSSDPFPSVKTLVQGKLFPTYIFNHLTMHPSDELKKASRELRERISEVISWKSSLSMQQCIQKLEGSLQQFKKAWDHYANSHEILQQAQTLMSGNDFYEDFYRVARARGPTLWNGYSFGDQNSLREGYERSLAACNCKLQGDLLLNLM